jgi:hypothetical protein
VLSVEVRGRVDESPIGVLAELCRRQKGPIRALAQVAIICHRAVNDVDLHPWEEDGEDGEDEDKIHGG